MSAPTLLCAPLMAALILAGALIWFRPFLTQKQQPTAGVPAPAGLFTASEVPVPSGGQACMSSVTVETQAHVAQFGLRPAKAGPRGGPPVDLVLNGPDYRATLHVPGGYPGGGVALPIAAPKRPLIATACFVNRGRTTVLLLGSTEARSVSRSYIEVDGRGVAGDIALTFLDDRSLSLLQRLDEVFGHASNLTDGLVPVWVIWIVTVLTAVGVPCAMTFALHRALREDELASRV